MNTDEHAVMTPELKVERRLAAIFSADVKGYSRLMGEDEVATVRTLTTYRAVMMTFIAHHRGRVVDAPGDNLLAEFASVVDAMQCAVALQHEIKRRNAELPPARHMEFRIGVYLGDVIVEGHRIYGDGVNIAARLESLADAGGICISRGVYDQVENKLELRYEDLGEKAVKNIARPVRVYRVVMEPTADTTAASLQEVVPLSLAEATEKISALTLPDKPSIAVLPFTNMSSDPEQEYFSDGITEDLITDLSKLSGLFVISRNSVFLYKGKVVKPEQVSRELGVRYVLEGSIRKAGSRVRITAQLIDATTGYHVWAERYDRELQDIFTLQDEVTRHLVAVLKIKLTEGEKNRFGHIPTTNLEAYDCYLRGLEYYTRRSQEANTQARQMFERAIALDPQFSIAYAFLGRTYLMELIYQWSTGPQLIDHVFTFGQKAVALDDWQPTAYETLALAYLARKQHAEAIAAAEQAITLDPNYADGYQTLAEILCFAGQPTEALRFIAQAMRLNPRYPPSYLWTLGHAYSLLGKREEALEALRRVVTRTPNLITARTLLAAIYSGLERLPEAQAEVAEILRINPQYSLAFVEQKIPYKEEALRDRYIMALRKAGLP